MSAEQPTYEETLQKQAALEKEVAELKKGFFAAKKHGTDEEDKEMEANFKKAMDEMNHKDKEHMAEHDDMDKMKDAFKKAQNETDSEKKKEAMKKAIEEHEDYEHKHSKKSKRAETEPSKQDKDKMEAKIANTIMKKIPLIEKILTATKVIDPTNYAKIEKELTAATLDEVEAKYASIKPYMAAMGMEGKPTSTSNQTPTMIPFQAGLINDTPNPDNIREGSVDTIDFSKVKTSDIERMYL